MKNFMLFVFILSSIILGLNLLIENFSGIPLNLVSVVSSLFAHIFYKNEEKKECLK